MGLSPVGFLGLFLTQTAGFHAYRFPLLGCMIVNARRWVVLISRHLTQFFVSGEGLNKTLSRKSTRPDSRRGAEIAERVQSCTKLSSSPSDYLG